MSAKGPASLTSALIVTKGNAAPAGLLAMNRNRAPSRPNNTARVPKSGSTAAAEGRNGPAQRARLTLRLDPDRHLKIRLAAAHMDLSLQDIITDALDRYLAEIKPPNLNGACNCLTGPDPAGAGKTTKSDGA
jgi:hypothetical protein